MINRIDISNRQSHSNTSIELHPQVNLIVGRGTSGKSAILRAVRWVIENTSGDAQVSNWIKRTTKGKDPKKVLDGESSVTITTPKGTVKRFRNPTENGYDLNGTRYMAVGAGQVPDQVSDFLGISEINIQRQHDLPFLISLPGTQVSAYLNRVVGISEINVYMKEAASCLKKAKEKTAELEEAQERDTKALDALGWVDGIQGQLDALDALQEAKGEVEAKLSKLSVLRCGLESEGTKLAQARKVADLESKVQEARKLAQAVTGVGSRLSSVARLVQGIEAAKESYAKASRVAGLAGDLEAAVRLDARVTAANEKRISLLEWMLKYRTVKESLTVASKVAGLSGVLEAVRESRRALEAEEGCLDALQVLVGSWVLLEARRRPLERLTALEAQVAKVRRMGRVLEDRRGELSALNHWSLTIQGFRVKLESKRSEVSELEAKRPERCPLCGGAYGKGECDAG